MRQILAVFVCLISFYDSKVVSTGESRISEPSNSIKSIKIRRLKWTNLHFSKRWRSELPDDGPGGLRGQGKSVATGRFWKETWLRDMVGPGSGRVTGVITTN